MRRHAARWIFALHPRPPQLHREYSDPNMLDALDAVHKFMSEHECASRRADRRRSLRSPGLPPALPWRFLAHRAPEEAMRALAAMKSDAPDRAKALDHARRRVQQWYSKLVRRTSGAAVRTHTHTRSQSGAHGRGHPAPPAPHPHRHHHHHPARAHKRSAPDAVPRLWPAGHDLLEPLSGRAAGAPLHQARDRDRCPARDLTSAAPGAGRSSPWRWPRARPRTES